MNVTSFYRVDYEINPIGNLAKTKPKQSQYKANTNPIPEMPKMNENLFAAKRHKKTTGKVRHGFTQIEQISFYRGERRGRREVFSQLCVLGKLCFQSKLCRRDLPLSKRPN